MTDPAPHANRIGLYPIEREIGRGGMGIVYLGRDTRLDRPVAIKVLPEAFAADPDRLARFEREARLLASLSHPNIAAIYGLEESSGRRFLVLEYVEGETLAQRIAHGPLPVDDSIDVCRQIAAALEAAHEGGVIHRDLKPGNVKLTPSGDVKVLDFGLAKGGTSSVSGSDPSLSASPTLAVSGATGAGVILGTAAYMSPEQARGRSLDRRTDIWSFGCVLYECLTGRQAFSGETVSDMIALILQGEPDWKALPAATPSRLRELLARCLTKDAKKRLRDIGEARLVLEGGEVSSASGALAFAAAEPARTPRLAVALAATFALVALALTAMLLLRSPAPAPVRRVSVVAPPMPIPPRDAALASLSPDGTMLASTAVDSTGTASLWLRSLDAIDGRILPGSVDGAAAFWSPDGRHLAFFTQDKLKKLDLRGGNPEVLCPVTSYGRGGSWGTRGVIVFSAGAEGPLYRVSQDGGASERATTLDSGETGHRFPRFLPDGRHFLFASMPAQGQQHTIYVGSVGDAKRRERLMTADGTPVYVEPGWLLYVRNGRTVAHRFDARARKLVGEPIALIDEPHRTQYLGAPSLIAGARGPIAYFREQSDLTRLAWLGLSGGAEEAVAIPPGPYESVAISPDASRAMLTRRTSQSEGDLWITDLEHPAPTRFTFGPGRTDRPVWSPDGTRIAYSTDRSGHWDVYVKAIDGTGAGEPVLESGSLLKYANGWTPDGQTLIYEQIGEKTGWDIWALPMQGDRTPRPLFQTAADEQFGAVSPDGRWIAYLSNESGRGEVYVESFPVPGRRHQISTSGGSGPVWRADGRAVLVFVGTGAAVIDVDPETGRAVGSPRPIPTVEDAVWAVPSPDLRRALVLVRTTGARDNHDLTLVDNWRTELRRK